MTEPLTPAQLASIGWAGREGMSDSGNQFHYFRRSADDRILWGGYDAVYHPGNRVTPAHDARPTTFEKLARQFVETFPQLDGHPVHPRLGRRDRHDDAVHGHLRRRPRRAGPLRARLHRARRRVEPMGGGHPARPAAPARLAAARPRARPLAAVPDPAGAHPDPGGGADAPRGHRCGRPRRPPLVVPARDGHAGDRLRLLARRYPAPLTSTGAIETMRAWSRCGSAFPSCSR